jgi:hypothetical protein
MRNESEPIPDGNPECRLNLALFIDTNHQRLLGWIKVEADDVAHLLDESRIAR